MATVGHQYLTQWLGDWLFVGDGDTTLEDDLGDLGPLLYGLSQRITARHGFDLMAMPCAWNVAVENTLEDYHVESVHRDTFGKMGMKREGMEQHGPHSLAFYTLTAERTVKSLSEIGAYIEDVRPDHYFHILLYPYTCLSSAGGASFSLQHYLPSGGFTNLHTRLYAGKVKPNSPDLRWWFDEAMAFNRRVFEQDSAACALVAGEGTFLTEGEARVAWFREAGRSS
jgi:phenylpropionate dioxygenase-like ring-hydroxylating dioxygenase large terminal subunit